MQTRRLAPPADDDVDFVLFCDEAGNVGANWLDDKQPFHVEAGWLVKRDDVARFEQVVSAAAKTSQGGELKGATLVRRSPRRVLTLLRNLGATGAVPLFLLADRRFCLAGKAVEVFLDPHTNPAAAWLEAGPSHRRQAIWEEVYSLADSALDGFATAYREPHPQLFALAATAIAEALRARGASLRLVGTFDAASSLAQTICAYETLGPDHAAHAVMSALNVPVFFHLLKKADRIVGAGGSKMRVVHDQTPQFETALARVTARMTFPENVSPEFRGPDGELVRMGVQNVADLQFRDSRASPGVQAADVLASTVARLGREARNDIPWSTEMRKLATMTLPLLLSEDDDQEPVFAGVLGHRDATAEMLVRLLLPPQDR